MLEQTIRLVTSETNPSGITLRFGPLGNKSHQKQFLKEIEKLANKEWEWIQQENNPNERTKEEVQSTYYDERFSTIQYMNAQGWKLESFALIYDTNLDRMQVAIFSRENLPLIEKNRMDE